jgi:hypothetical protein
MGKIWKHTHWLISVEEITTFGSMCICNVFSIAHAIKRFFFKSLEWVLILNRLSFTKELQANSSSQAKDMSWQILSPPEFT